MLRARPHFMATTQRRGSAAVALPPASAERGIGHSGADRESEGPAEIKYLWLLSITTKTLCHQSLWFIRPALSFARERWGTGADGFLSDIGTGGVPKSIGGFVSGNIWSEKEWVAPARHRLPAERETDITSVIHISVTNGNSCVLWPESTGVREGRVARWEEGCEFGSHLRPFCADVLPVPVWVHSRFCSFFPQSKDTVPFALSWLGTLNCLWAGGWWLFVSRCERDCRGCNTAFTPRQPGWAPAPLGLWVQVKQ